MHCWQAGMSQPVVMPTHIHVYIYIFVYYIILYRKISSHVTRLARSPMIPLSYYSSLIFVFICLSIAYSPSAAAKSSTGNDSDAKRETMAKRKKRKDHQSSVAVEPKSIIDVVTLQYVMQVCVCFNYIERRWDICVRCKGNPRVSEIVQQFVLVVCGHVLYQCGDDRVLYIYIYIYVLHTLCVVCLQGGKCDHQMCKSCCKAHCWAESVPCSGNDPFLLPLYNAIIATCVQVISSILVPVDSKIKAKENMTCTMKHLEPTVEGVTKNPFPSIVS